MSRTSLKEDMDRNEKESNEKQILLLQGQLNRRIKQLDMAYEWLTLSVQHKTISSYFQVRGITKIAIYGIAEFGQILFKQLQHIEGIDVVGFIDRTANDNRFCCGLQVYLPEEVPNIEDLDMIVVSAIVAYDSIVKTMVKIKADIPIVSLETIIQECSLEEEHE